MAVRYSSTSLRESYSVTSQHIDLFDPTPLDDEAVHPRRPRVLSIEEWAARDYRSVYAWRMRELALLRADPMRLSDAKAYYSTRPKEFICDWQDTYNPRLKRNKWMPFILFKRQGEFIDFLESLRHDGEHGLIEKARDMGASWLGCAYSVWCLTFLKDDATGWGSRKEDSVDKKGDPDSLFEKMRLLINRMPEVFRPDCRHAFLKITNEQNGSTLTGEAGDNIGRGGRKSRFFVDESAHIERAELLEASLGDTTDVRIDMSSVNGVGNMFHRRREAGEIWSPGAQIERGMIRVFIFDWRDHPDKTQEWYDTRKAKHEREGTQHVFAQEVDRNYSAAVENTVIQGEWVDAAIDAHLHVPAIVADGDDWMGGLDLADEGGDKNALVLRQGVVLRYADEWGERDPGATTRRVIQTIRERQHRRLAIQYDSIGIGTNVKSEFNRLIETGDLNAADIRLVPWNAGAAVLNPYDRVIPDDEGSILNRAMFHNFKAQAWWALRTRFYKTYRARMLGDIYRGDELISIERASIPVNVLSQLRKELVQPIRKMSGTSSRMLVEKSPNGARSPNIADAMVQCYFPAHDGGTEITLGSMRG